MIALALASAFTGAATYINLAEQPARLALDDQSLLMQWKHSYRRAAGMQAALLVVAGGLGLLSAWQLNNWRWLVGAIALLANGPYTVLVIMPINKRLNSTAIERADATARAMIITWGRLHAVRTMLGVVAILAYVWVLN
jgi:hypothetical protein